MNRKRKIKIREYFKSKKLKYLWLLFLLLFISYPLYGQLQLPTPPPTPNTASLGKFGMMPVSLFTGTPTVSIPLYEFEVRGTKLPLVLEYDASGLLINTLPGWLGHNWSLEAGGVITRTARGRYDEWIYPQQSLQNFGYTPVDYYHSLGMLPSLVQNTSNDHAALKEESVKKMYDLAADVFTFNFMGHAGRFFLDNYGNWRVMCEENIEVLFDYNDTTNFTSPFISKYPKSTAIDRNQPKTIKRFKLRDGEGTVYEFGGDMDAIEFTTDFFNMGGNEDNESWHAMSWYLTRVIDKYGNLLYELSYDRGCYIIHAYNSFEAIKLEESNQWTECFLGFIPINFGTYGQTMYNFNMSFPYGFSINSPVYLKEIRGSNGVVASISSSDSPIATQDMFPHLYDGYGASGLYNRLAQSVHDWFNPEMMGAFHYLQSDDAGLSAYRYNPPNPNICDVLSFSRLRKLDRIYVMTDPAIYDGADKSTMAYVFHYGYSGRMHFDSLKIYDRTLLTFNNGNRVMDGTYRFFYENYDSIPSDYLTKAYDHWGYYNGRPYGNISDFIGFKQTRNPDFSKARFGSLREIQYPTGGTTVFEYEPNAFAKRASDDRQSLLDSVGIGGGLRVKTITDYEDAIHSKVLSRRTYSYLVPGTQTSSGELFAAPKYYWPSWKAYCVESSARSYMSTFRTSSIIPLSNSFGPPLGYTYVTETNADSTKTVYHFSNLSNPYCRDERFLLDFQGGTVTPYDEYSEKGFMRGKLLCRTMYSASGSKLRSTGNVYRSDNTDAQHTLTYNMGYINHGNSTSFGYYSGGVYKMYYPKYDLEAVNDTVFESGTFTVTHTSYTKEDRTLIMADGHATDARLLVSETIQRAGTSFGHGYEYPSPTHALVTQMHCLNPVKVKTYKDGSLTTSHETIYKQIVCNGTPKQVPEYLVETNSQGGCDTLVHFKNYTSRGALWQYKERGQPETFLKWGYDDHYLMIRSTDYITPNFSNSTIFNSANTLNTIKNYINSTSGQATGYVYEPLVGLVYSIDPRAQVTRYTYDLFGRLSGVYDDNGSALEIYDYNLAK